MCVYIYIYIYIYICLSVSCLVLATLHMVVVSNLLIYLDTTKTLIMFIPLRTLSPPPPPPPPPPALDMELPFLLIYLLIAVMISHHGRSAQGFQKLPFANFARAAAWASRFKALRLRVQKREVGNAWAL